MHRKLTLLAAALVVLTLGAAVVAEDAATTGKPEITKLVIGKKISNFTLPNQLGKKLTVADLNKDRWLLLAFYPKSGTPG